ncbi:hypothetical protein FHR83_008728 [Actinoplanes campanulatus]|uniref:Polyketide cyclase / dehydrase and lipid transport n=1 Tax=Actinoplanes campanulatus TaxID=113559 RepID=A0A7W5ARG1_9ACTN|nr:hypothetical protein [Actinoplanes campanulatus]MBB3101001.1 hypothetical protein [Actinoplanes campanulatus]GGN49185.1 hypothetical protein GCM10010109_86940 [Actinoplanes campanulatus]GID41819.1 hypothetical protein Aca09nite_83250 [Actinoplanes campanulatus]
MEKFRIRSANIVLTGIVIAFGVVFFTMTVRAGKADSALLFVVLPTVLAAALTLTPGRSTHGTVFRLTTVGLLLAAVALHEGAICVVLAAPLVYGVAHLVTFLCQMFRDRDRIIPVLLPIPLLLAGVEGVNPEWRVDPDQSVQVSRVVAAAPADVAARLAAGPRPVATRSLPLRLLGVPTPGHVHGTGLTVGDRWMFGYHGSAHGPGGQIVTEVRAATDHEITFAILEDTSITGRWVRMRDATISWQPSGTGTEVTVRIDYRRGLDPSWYFGPLQDGFLHAGAGHFLDMLALP